MQKRPAVIKSYKDMGTVIYTLLTLPLAADEAAFQQLENYDAALSVVATYGKVLGLDLKKANTEQVEQWIGEAQKRAGKIEKAIQADQYVTYRVRGLAPLEQQEMVELIQATEPPVPPKKTREVLPLDRGSKIVPEDIRDEQYDDFDDPAYRASLVAFSRDVSLGHQRGIMYSLVVCVDGFDLSDEEIQEELGEPAHPKQPVEEFRQRLDQLSRIILSQLDGRHLAQIQDRINELSGVEAARVNFT
jgi:hypothetical protein